MRSRVHPRLPSEVGEFADDVRRLFLELGRAFGPESLAGECSPAIDVFETDDAVEVVVDLPGVDPSAVRVVAKGDALLVAGEKTRRPVREESTFHLVERDFGRFARVIAVGRSCEFGSATARLVGGELRIRAPKREDRRGRSIPIAVTK
jgi:HSP20 family protein